MIGREKKSCAEVMILKHFLTNMPELEVLLFVITSSSSLTSQKIGPLPSIRDTPKRTT